MELNKKEPPKEEIEITAEALKMNAFLESYDPLATLEAEYQAVISQTIPGTKEEEEGEEESDEEEEEYVEEEEAYSLLPSSPIGSDDEQEEEEEVMQEKKVDKNIEKVVYKPLETDKKQLIMEKMRSFQLQPPSWAKEMEMSDTELVHMIQHRLSINSKPPAAA